MTLENKLKVTLWVCPNGSGLMARLGFVPVAYLSGLTDEDGDMVSGYVMPLTDAEAAIELITEHNTVPCNDCFFIKAYIK